MSLIDKIRKARETTVEAGGHQFTIRRPTDEEAIMLSRDDIGLVAIVRRFTLGWDLAEIDLIPGGGPEKVPFSAELFGEWVSDRPQVWEPLGNAIMAAYTAHATSRDAALKN
jgi:hypothetical protein